MIFSPLRFLKNEPNIDFMGKRWLWFMISAAMIAVSIFLLASRGLNWGIDFTGGVLMEIRTEEPADLAKLRPLFPANEFGEVTLQHFGDDREVMIRLELAEDEDQAALISKVKKRLADANIKVEYRKIDYVGPTVGRELIQAGALALGLAVIAILLYIWFRFEWQFGVGAVIALIHDAIITMGFYALSGYEFGLASIAALLTILGYSINDSVVIFDRVREIRRKYKKMQLTDIINKSLNLNLTRTLLTSGTTLMALVALVLFGGEVIRGFAAAILFGVAIGTYSSIYVAVPILIYLGFTNENDETQNATTDMGHDIVTTK